MHAPPRGLGPTGCAVLAPFDVKIRWGEGGDWTRCVAELGKYVDNPQGLCERYHEAATGMTTAEHTKVLNAAKAKKSGH